MRFHVLTLFPDMVQQGLGTSILGRAVQAGYIEIEAVNIRDYTQNKHNRVDDYPYGGGAGMLMQAQPVYDAWKAVRDRITEETSRETGLLSEAAHVPIPAERKLRTIYLTPQGQTFTQDLARELAKEEDLIFLCGHYEGIDERVLEETVTDYVSIGDYVLTGGELPAMVMIDAIARLVPGVLNNHMSAETESFHADLLEYPQYSRPEVWQGKSVPQVLLGGDHKKIRDWRLEQSIERTRNMRPDLYARYERAQKCRSRLLKEKLLHMDMIELLARGRAGILFDGPEGILLRDKESGVFMITATDEQSGRKLADQTKELVIRENGGLKDLLLVSHREYLNPILAEMYGLKAGCGCYQAVYTRKEAVPKPRVTAVIRPLTLEHLDTVDRVYENGSRAYLKDRIHKGCLFGAFQEEELAGFIGVHEEGSIGMLEVLPAYRRQGIGRALEAHMINLFLEKGFVPYGQVKETNAQSLQMQESMGLYCSKEKVYWLFF